MRNTGELLRASVMLAVVFSTKMGCVGLLLLKGPLPLLSEGDKFLQKGYSYGTFLRVTYEKAHVSMKMLTSVQLSLEVSHLTVHSTSMVE